MEHISVTSLDTKEKRTAVKASASELEVEEIPKSPMACSIMALDSDEGRQSSLSFHGFIEAAPSKAD